MSKISSMNTEKSKDNNKSAESSPRPNIPINPIKIFQINFDLTKVMIATLAILAVIYFSGVLSSKDDASEVSISLFVSNIKENKYAKVDIRDDGKAAALGKYLISSPITSDFNLEQKENTVKINLKDGDFEEIDLDGLYELLRPLSLEETLQAITNPGKFPRTKALYIGSNFTIAVNADNQGRDYLVKDAGESALKAKLTEKGVEIANLAIKVNYLRMASAEEVPAEFVNLYNNNKFGRVWQLDKLVVAELKPDEVVQEFVFWQPVHDNFTEFLQREGISFESGTMEFNSVIIPTVPWGEIVTYVILGGFILLGFTMFRGIQGSGNSLIKFGQSKARMVFGRRPDVTFKDVAGVDEAKEELNEIVLFLKDSKRFLNLGARIPKGVIMVGAPGTGKTLLARAIAGEAGVPFFHTSGSEFEEMLVGAGASRVRDLFEKAKRAAPALIFIDEIVAVARKRGTTIQSSTTEQTLNQILVEMDGFERNTNVIVIAATNRPDVLDPAILRPGRFDRRIVLDMPDIEGRKAIIKIHAANKPIAKSVNIEKLAKRTVGFSGADLENMLNEAAIIVAKDSRKEILEADLEEAANKVQIGPAKKRKRTEKELRMTAYHEAGHSLVMKLTPESDPVHRVTIISRGMALGYTMPLPESDQLQMTQTQMVSKITSLLAGFATEEMIFGDVTSGASNDIEKATVLARKMVKQFGMSKRLGLVKYGEEQDLKYLGYSYGEVKDYSEESAKLIDEEVRRIMHECFENAKKIIKDNKVILDKLVETLLEKEVLDAEEFNTFFK